LVESHTTTVIIPFNDRVIFVRSLNCAEFSSRLSEVAQTLDAISGIQFLAGGSGLGERWPLGTVGVMGRPGPSDFNSNRILRAGAMSARKS
jgi:hypothetical protein